MSTSQIVSIHEAKTHLSKLIQRALDGEELPVVEVPVAGVLDAARAGLLCDVVAGA